MRRAHWSCSRVQQQLGSTRGVEEGKKSNSHIIRLKVFNTGCGSQCPCRTTLSRLPHLGVENWVKLQAGGIVTEGLWARGKSSQCQLLGQNFSHEWLIKKPNTAFESRSSPLHTPSLGCPMAWLAPTGDAARQVPGPPRSNQGSAGKQEQGQHTAPPNAP